MSPRPPSIPRSLVLFARFAALRLGHRLSAQLRRRKRSKGPRSATPRKLRGGGALALVVVALLLFQGINLAGMVVTRIAHWATDSTAVSLSTYRQLQDLEDSRQLDPGDLIDPAGDSERTWAELLRILGSEVAKDDEREDEFLTSARRQRRDELAQKFEERGIAGFRIERPMIIDTAFAWPADDHLLLRGLASLTLLLAFSLTFMSLGSSNQDLGRVDWNLEWFFTFPVKTSGIFLASTVEYALLNVFSWCTTFPLWIAIYFVAGLGWAGVGWAVASTLYCNVFLATLRVVLETWLRLRLTPGRLKNLQAFFSVGGIVFLYAIMYLGIGKRLPDWFGILSDAPGRIALWLPPGLPVHLVARGSPPLLVAGAMGISAAALLLLGAWLPARLVRRGLLVAGGPYQGSRKPAGSQWAFAPTSVRGKELRLLARDRNLLVQVLVVPLAIFGFQIAINPTLFQAAAEDARHGASLAFGIGSYVLMFGGLSVLSVEGNALWLLYTFPRRLEGILREKTLIWSTISMLYTLAVLAVLIRAGMILNGGAMIAFAMALAGVGIFSFIASGIGVLGTDPLEVEVRRRLRPGKVYVYMLLATMYGYGIYSPNLWPKVVLVVLTTLLAYAIWQKVHDQIPYLLDPTASPPPALDLSDGLIATLAFFVTQSVVVILFQQFDADLGMGAQLTIAYCLASLLVVVFASSSLALRGVSLFRREANERTWSLPRAIPLGALFGALGGGVGFAYLTLLDGMPVLTKYKEEASQLLSSADDLVPWIRFLALFVAPLFEEFLFRRLVFRGMRRTLPLWAAVLGSAAIFAMVHPPLAAVPVFLMGVSTALVYHWTERLSAAIACHMVYNAAVVLVVPLLTQAPG